MDINKPIILKLSEIIGEESFNDSIYLIEDSNILIVGNDYKLIFVDISNK
jgi:hypothetical protein